MFVNPFLFFALGLAVLLFIGGRWWSRRVVHRAARGLTALGLLLLCLPGLSFIAYYAHLFGEPLWYVEFRSVPGTELLAAMPGLFLGFLHRPTPAESRTAYTISASLLLLISLFLTFLPFCKPVLRPVERADFRLQDVWQQNVCMQTCGSTCGAAALATVLAYHGAQFSEREVARGSYSCASGTELWYLRRFARNQGMRVNVLHKPDLAQVPVPSVIGTTLGGPGGVGHFITLLGVHNGLYTIGDPMGGAEELTEAKFRQYYTFTGCVLHVTPR